MTEDEARLIRLEETVAHQARTIDELSEQLTQQWKLVEQMRRKLDQLTDSFLALEEQALGPAPVTRPPHY
ncbi:SlyX family protein [Allorhizobium undicola]|uniref:SlyX family protein n=1 Tax=Allorhizobium undicola TaxID=78527 RepID=UPI000488E438